MTQQPEFDPKKAFAILLETACEQFEILTALLNGNLKVVPNSDISDNMPLSTRGAIAEALKDYRILRTPSTMCMALAKSFVFTASRIYRLCEDGARDLEIDPELRKLYLNSMRDIRKVRDVNEHGYDLNKKAKSRPTFHVHDDGTLDETSLIAASQDRILMGPLNLMDVYIILKPMKEKHGMEAIRRGQCK